MNTAILQPLCVLVAWSLVMWVWLYATRIPAMSNMPGVNPSTLVGTTGADMRGKVRPKSSGKPITTTI